MRRSSITLVAALSMFAAACARNASDAPACGSSLELTGSGIGELRIGRPVTELRESCNVVGDTVLAAGTEGQPERRIAVRIGNDTLHATVVDDRVWRIDVDTHRFRTADTLGVGSVAADLRRHGAVAPFYGEGKIFTIIPALCGVSFRLAVERHPVPVERGWDALPASAPVDRVLIFGCDGSVNAERN